MSWRRSAAAALIALQAVIAVSPMLELRDEVRRDTHVEAQGNPHLFGHDEATCTVCAVRTLVGDVLAEPAALFANGASDRVDIAYAPVVHPAGVSPGNHSRAPPVLS